MKIVYTGGGTGGHFYPIIAVADEVTKLLEERKLVDVRQYYISDTPYNRQLLDERNIEYIELKTGKARVYFSIQNFFDRFRIAGAVLRALPLLYRIFPDVVFSKGGYPSFPVVAAAAFFGIPIIIHESDSVPGRANVFAAKFADRIAVSYPEAARFFPEDRVAWTGNPIRRELLAVTRGSGYEQLGLNPHIPTIFILGGSQGAQFINDLVLRTLPLLLEKYQVVHQIGIKNIAPFTDMTQAVLETHPHYDRYHPFAYLNEDQMRAAAGAATLIISRGGSTIFEIAAWGVPAIIIPITRSNGDHQRKNAYTYARAHACIVIEEENVTPNLFVHEIEKLLSDKKRYDEMARAAKDFASLDAAEKIARQIVSVLEEHGKMPAPADNH